MPTITRIRRYPHRDRVSQPASVAAGSFAIIILASLLVLAHVTMARANALDDELKAITDTADRICGIVATSGDYQSVKAQGDVNAQIDGLLKKLASLGISGDVSLNTEDYKGVLRSDLPTALKNVIECKLKVFDTLQKKILPDLSGSGQPHGDVTPDPVASPGKTIASFVPAATPGHTGWLQDRNTGCHIWDTEPETGETITWSGECQDGAANGPGTVEFRSSTSTDRYVGAVASGRLTGHGKLTFSNGQTEDGEFVDGAMNGLGHVTWANGARYEGELVDGKASGFGIYTTSDGRVYKGQWVNGCIFTRDGPVTVGGTRCR